MGGILTHSLCCNYLYLTTLAFTSTPFTQITIKWAKITNYYVNITTFQYLKLKIISRHSRRKYKINVFELIDSKYY